MCPLRAVLDENALVKMSMVESEVILNYCNKPSKTQLRQLLAVCAAVLRSFERSLPRLRFESFK